MSLALITAREFFSSNFFSRSRLVMNSCGSIGVYRIAL